jgi:hypothetical protein
MMCRKIAGPIFIKSGGAGAEARYELPESGGGRMVKVLSYWVEVESSSGGATDIAVDVEHGTRTGWLTTLKSGIVAYSGQNISAGKTLTGAVGAAAQNSEVIGEVIKPILKIKAHTGATDQTATVNIYEMRKPF